MYASNSAHEAPPPYTPETRSPSPDSLALIAYTPQTFSARIESTREARKLQLRRYLLEIVAFTLSVDMDQLAPALGHTQPTTPQTNPTSLLSETERAELLYLSLSIKLLKDKVHHNQFNTTRQDDRDAVYFSVLEPPAYTISDAFLLDIISTYADHQCAPQNRHLTLMAHWSPKQRFWRPKSARLPYSADLVLMLASHANLIGYISPNEGTQHLLGAALERYQERIGYAERARYSGWYGPVRCRRLDGLAEALREHARHSRHA